MFHKITDGEPYHKGLNLYWCKYEFRVIVKIKRFMLFIRHRNKALKRLLPGNNRTWFIGWDMLPAGK